MEYCEVVIGNNESKRKWIRLFEAAAVTTFIAAAACKMPSLELGLAYPAGMPYENLGYTGKAVMFSKEDSSKQKRSIILSGKLGQLYIPARTLQESIGRYKRDSAGLVHESVLMNYYSDIFDSPLGDVNTEIAADNFMPVTLADITIPTVPEGDNGQERGIQAVTIVPEIPKRINVPDPDTVQDIPRENIVPDIPDRTMRPEQPGESVNPAVPGGNIEAGQPGESVNPAVPGGTVKPVAPGESMNPAVPGGNVETVQPGESVNPAVPGGTVDPEAPGESMNPAVPGGNVETVQPGESVVPTVPGGTVEPEAPGENVKPSVPDGALEPELPGEDVKPDIPGENVKPDLPSGSDTGNLDMTAGFEVNEEGMIYSFIPGEAAVEDGGYLALPSNGCSGILGGTFTGAGAEIYDIFIPSCITYIEENAFCGLDCLFGIDVEESNPNYASDGGVLFDKTKSALLAFPSARVGTYSVPQGVSVLAGYSFAGTNLSKLDMRACGIVEVGNALFGEGDGNGIVIMAPKEYLAQYQEIFAGYNVTVQ